MRRLAVLVSGGLGLGVVWRRLRRGGGHELESDPAAELRARLAEAKAADRPEAERPVEEPAAEDSGVLDPVSRRRAIHERARGAIDELG
jgi:hypothetical protein